MNHFGLFLDILLVTGAAFGGYVAARLRLPTIIIVLRGSGLETHELPREMGASEIVAAEFKASLEFVRHVVHRFGVDAREIAAIQASRRARHYRVAE